MSHSTCVRTLRHDLKKGVQKKLLNQTGRDHTIVVTSTVQLQSPSNSTCPPAFCIASTSSIVHGLGTYPGGIFELLNNGPPDTRLAAALA